MEIRPATPADAERLCDIDGTIESARHMHIERNGEGIAVGWHLEERSLRQKLIAANPLDDESRFILRQITSGADEGLAIVAEHAGVVVASLLAQPQRSNRTLRLIDVRVDYDDRRQGIGLAMLCRSIQAAQEQQLRAVTARTLSNNVPAGQFLLKAGFDLAGLDLQLHSNHDLLKEAVALFWYAPLD